MFCDLKHKVAILAFPTNRSECVASLQAVDLID
jgi:hypothetical protein